MSVGRSPVRHVLARRRRRRARRWSGSASERRSGAQHCSNDPVERCRIRFDHRRLHVHGSFRRHLAKIHLRFGVPPSVCAADSMVGSRSPQLSASAERCCLAYERAASSLFECRGPKWPHRSACEGLPELLAVWPSPLLGLAEPARLAGCSSARCHRASERSSSHSLEMSAVKRCRVGEPVCDPGDRSRARDPRRRGLAEPLQLHSRFDAPNLMFRHRR